MGSHEKGPVSISTVMRYVPVSPCSAFQTHRDRAPHPKGLTPRKTSLPSGPVTTNTGWQRFLPL